MSDRIKKAGIDWGFLILILIIMGLGLLTLTSASFGASGAMSEFALKQSKWFLLGFGAMLVFSKIDYRFYQNSAFAIYGVLVLTLVVVLILGKTSMGAQRWLALGPLRIQPSEFMKLGIAVAVANALATLPELPPYGFRDLIKPALITGVPALLVAMQPDLGTAIIIVGVACAIVAFQGVQLRVVARLAIGGVLAMPVFWFALKEYQRQRILTFLDPGRDSTGAGYHIIQSKIAIGSGQLLGKGYLKGTQSHLSFLPERHTDFIFSVFAEEWGFVGSAFVVVMFLLLILWGLDIAVKARDSFGRLLAIGLTSILFFHAVVNMGMVTGLLPVVGVPLPLFSYGGSSVLTTSIIVGILLNIRMKRFLR